jgi:hypothetical protein
MEVSPESTLPARSERGSEEFFSLPEDHQNRANVGPLTRLSAPTNPFGQGAGLTQIFD